MRPCRRPAIYDVLFLHGARTFESFCRLAGKTELADRVRPSVSRPGRTEVPPDEEVLESLRGDVPQLAADSASTGSTTMDSITETADSPGSADDGDG